MSKQGKGGQKKPKSQKRRQERKRTRLPYVPPLLTPHMADLLRLLATKGIEGTSWIEVMRRSHRKVTEGLRHRGFIEIARLPVDNVRLTSSGWEIIRRISPGLMPRTNELPDDQSGVAS